MAGPGVAVRCPACGTELRAYPAPLPPTQWFPCPHCRTAVPVVVPRDPPPLYSWEVFPVLYPPLERPRASRWRLGPAVAIALAAVAVAAAVLGAGLIAYGIDAGRPASYTVSGVVVEVNGGRGVAAAGAEVVLTDNAGARSIERTGVDGQFSFAEVPSGGVSINVSLAGYAPTTLATFVAPGYNAGSLGLTIPIYAAPENAALSISLAPFATLESFLASVYAAAALLGIVAAVAALAALPTWRGTRRTGGVIGGSAGVAAPAVIYLLSLYPAIPVFAAATGVVAGFGAFAVGFAAAELYRTGTPAETA